MLLATKPSEPIAVTLKKIALIIPRLGSDHDGEALAAARAIGRTLATAHCGFTDLAEALAPAARPVFAARHVSQPKPWKHVAMWCDEKFRSLSMIQPSGQALWLYLLTGPQTGIMPGLFRAGRAGMAEELEWSVEQFDERFHELFEKGMAKADFKARIVWLPNAIKHNPPANPNIVKSWKKEFDLLPECPLKLEAYEALKMVPKL